MTDGARQGDAPADDDAAIARHNWIAEQLGEQWRSEGDGVYRFVGPPEPSRAARSLDSPRAHDEASGAPAPWLDLPETDRTPSPRPRPSHLPWRRR